MVNNRTSLRTLFTVTDLQCLINGGSIDNINEKDIFFKTNLRVIHAKGEDTVSDCQTVIMVKWQRQ